MDNISKVYSYTFDLFGRSITVDHSNIIMTWVMMGILLLIGVLISRKLETVPGKSQNIVEIKGFYNLQKIAY